MARKVIVSRTIKATKCSVLCVDTDTQETETKEVIVARTWNDPDKLLKKVKALVDTDTYKAVQVIGTEIIEKRYGMSEEKFIENSEELPPLPPKKDMTEDED